MIDSVTQGLGLIYSGHRRRNLSALWSLRCRLTEFVKTFVSWKFKREGRCMMIVSRRAVRGLKTALQRLFTRRGDSAVMQRGPIEELEPRRLLAGVTLVTHGFQVNEMFPQWVDSMSFAITQRIGAPGVDYSLYKATVGGSTVNPTITSFQRLAGPPSLSTRYETVIELDWSVFSALPFPGTGAIAAAVVDLLYNVGPATNLTGPLAALPLHLIGHSRGGVRLCLAVATTILKML